MPEPALSYDAVTFSYPGAAAPALENISLTVQQGERLGILGPNGGGKSTLLKLTLGLLNGSGRSGRIRVFGSEPAEARRLGLVGYVPQRNDAELGFPISVRDMVTLQASWRCSPLRGVPSRIRDAVTQALDLVDAGSYADSPVGALSGGQLQRAMIARALVGHDGTPPKILILDEPAVGIDVAGQQRFASLLQQLHAAAGMTIVIVSHDLRAIVAGCDRVACLARRLHSHVSPQGLTPQVLGELFSHDVAGVLGGVHVHAHAAADCGHCGHDHSVDATQPFPPPLPVDPLSPVHSRSNPASKQGGGHANA